MLLSPLLLTTTLAASTPLRAPIHCIHRAGQPIPSVTACNGLIRVLHEAVPSYRETEYHYTEATVTVGRDGCWFQLKSRKRVPSSRERLRLADYEPAFRRIGDECLGKGEPWNGGETRVGQLFVARLGAEAILGKGGNLTTA